MCEYRSLVGEGWGEGATAPSTKRRQSSAALDEIAARFREIAAGSEGPAAILPYSYCGTMGKIQSQSLDRRFFHRLGASKLDRTICATAGGLAPQQ